MVNFVAVALEGIYISDDALRRGITKSALIDWEAQTIDSDSIHKAPFILLSPRDAMPSIEVKFIDRVAQRRRHPAGANRVNPRPIARLGDGSIN